MGIFAWRNLLTRPLRTTLALVGLSIPILGVLGLFSVSNGLRNLVGETLGGIEGLIVLSDLNSGFWAFRMDGFNHWKGSDWNMPNTSSVQDWDHGPKPAVTSMVSPAKALWVFVLNLAEPQLARWIATRTSHGA